MTPFGPRGWRATRVDVRDTALALLPLVLLWADARHAIESRMSLHMLGEFPLLAAAGFALHGLASRHGWLTRARDALARLDWRGLTGATAATLVTLAWMAPVLLDASLLSPIVAAVKYTSWWIAGCMLAGSRRRMDPEVMLFAVGNGAWMTATAGLLYVDAPARLCVSYLQDDQRIAGAGLLVLSVVAGLAVLRRIVRADHMPSASSAASDMRERSHGGSNTICTSTSPIPGSARSLSATSLARIEPMPQPGAVSVIWMSTRVRPSGSGDSSQP
jgi:hypothetical protein